MSGVEVVVESQTITVSQETQTIVVDPVTLETIIVESPAGAISVVSGGPQGPPGIDGSSITFRGEWESDTEYFVNDVVTYFGLGGTGSSYIAIADSTGFPPESINKWAVIAAKGAQGDPGVDGSPDTALQVVDKLVSTLSDPRDHDGEVITVDIDGTVKNASVLYANPSRIRGRVGDVNTGNWTDVELNQADSSFRIFSDDGLGNQIYTAISLYAYGGMNTGMQIDWSSGTMWYTLRLAENGFEIAGPSGIFYRVITTEDLDTHIAASDPHGDRAYAEGLFAANDAMIFKGAIDCRTDPDFPAANSGWLYKIEFAGEIGGASGVNVEVGDSIICSQDGSLAGSYAAVGESWFIIQANLDGAVIGPVSSTNGNVAVFDGTGGKVIADGGTLGTAAFTDSTDYDASGAAAAAQAAAIAASDPVGSAGAVASDLTTHE